MCAHGFDYDIAVIGGGIVGMATARALSQQTDASLLVLEAENRVAVHQTGHNSGVVHSGIYYRPGSLKARLCHEGREALYAFCTSHGVEHERCGKVIVAANDSELSRLDMLHERGVQNGLIRIERLTPDELYAREPHARGVGGLWVGDTGIVDFGRVVEAMSAELRGLGGQLRTSARVLHVEVGGNVQRLITTSGDVAVRWVVNCAGLESDRVARMCGVEPDLRIVPFRGEYYNVAPVSRHLVRKLIYPVPDPQFPFLGVHFTRGVDGHVEVGPNAVLAMSRRGYKWHTISPADIWDFVSYRGFRRLMRKQWRMGLGEMYRSVSKRAFVKVLQKLVPAIAETDLVPGGAGVRAQAVDPEGRLIDDFRIITTDRSVHVLNAPSPAATASLAIGRHIAQETGRALNLPCKIRASGPVSLPPAE